MSLRDLMGIVDFGSLEEVCASVFWPSVGESARWSGTLMIVTETLVI